MAFVSAFTGSHFRSSPDQLKEVRRPNKRSGSVRSSPKAVLGSRTSSGVSFGSQQQVQKFTVKVMEKDRCTIVEVDRDTDLRKALLAAKVDLYTLGGKLRNCGGGGQCGTCLIDVEDGTYNTNGRTPKEEFLLENKPDSWRLACRTMVHGDVTIRTKPKA